MRSVNTGIITTQYNGTSPLVNVHSVKAEDCIKEFGNDGREFKHGYANVGYGPNGEYLPVTRVIFYKVNGRNHVCSSICRNARHGNCECSCKGVFHGADA